MIEGVYGRKQHMRKKRGLRKHKKNIREIQGKNKYGGEEARKVRYRKRTSGGKNY